MQYLRNPAGLRYMKPEPGEKGDTGRPGNDGKPGRDGLVCVLESPYCDIVEAHCYVVSMDK